MFWTFVAGVHALAIGVNAVAAVTRRVRGRMTRPSAKRPRGKLRTVRGIARGPHVPSPFEGVPCLFAWVRLVSENSLFHRVEREVAVGQDFVLESPEGRFTVRLDGLRLRGGPALDSLQPVAETLEGVVARVIEAAHMEQPTWAEIRVRDGDELEVTGVCRMEPALEAGAGFRESALSPTLSGAGGRLDVRFIR